jgi:predicted glycosyltransferase
MVATGIPGARSLFSSDEYQVTELVAPIEFTVWGGAHELTTASDTQRQVLADELRKVITQWEPDAFVTPHYGGLAGELSLVYPLLRERRVRTILALRDFYDSDGFADQALLEASLKDYIDQVIVFAPEHATGGLPHVVTQEKLAPLGYAGYVPPPTAQGPPDRATSELDGITVYCQVGGGADGGPLVQAAVVATLEATRAGARVTLNATIGPFAPDAEFAEAQRRLGSAGIIERWRFRDELAGEPASDLRISMAGYNSCVEALWDGANTLVFPRLRSGDREQATRARFFEAEFGAVHTAEAKSHAQIVESILKAFLRRPTCRRIPPNCFLDHLTVARWIAGDRFDTLLGGPEH